MPTRGHYLKAVEAKNMCLVTHSSQKATQMFCHEKKCIAKKEKIHLIRAAIRLFQSLS